VPRERRLQRTRQRGPRQPRPGLGSRSKRRPRAATVSPPVQRSLPLPAFRPPACCPLPPSPGARPDMARTRPRSQMRRRHQRLLWLRPPPRPPASLQRRRFYRRRVQRRRVQRRHQHRQRRQRQHQRKSPRPQHQRPPLRLGRRPSRHLCRPLLPPHRLPELRLEGQQAPRRPLAWRPLQAVRQRPQCMPEIPSDRASPRRRHRREGSLPVLQLVPIHTSRRGAPKEKVLMRRAPRDKALQPATL
jgi:hypothetical protein